MQISRLIPVSLILVMNSQKVVMPAKAGIQSLAKSLKSLDSRLRGNDENRVSPTFFGFIILVVISVPPGVPGQK